MTESTTTWQEIPAGPIRPIPRPSGRLHVKSGSDGTALDGTKYADWYHDYFTYA